MPPAPPVITDILGETTLNGSDLANLTCEANGKPTPNITWTRVSDSGPVKFPFIISKQDEGLYRCTADNGIGNLTSRHVYITIQCKLKLSINNKLVNSAEIMVAGSYLQCRW